MVMDFNDGSGPQRQWVERSRKPDWVLRSVTVMTLIGWVAAMVALVMYYMGTPKEGDIQKAVDSINPNIGATAGINVSNAGLLRGTFFAILASCVICVIGFILNFTRKKRKTDKFNKLLITLGIVSVVFLAVFLINHAGLIF